MWPKLSSIDSTIVNKIKNTTPEEYSGLNCFVRVISGTSSGLIMVSNPDWGLFSAAGQSAGLYGNQDRSGTVGVDWDGNAVNVADVNTIDVPFKPSPIVTSIDVKEGKDQISRHCDLKFTAFTLGQVELIQKYFMEPGHSVVVEWGWNTPNGVSGLLPINDKLVTTVGERNLNQDNLVAHRISTQGEYDSFFGFIVGGSVNSNGDLFDISIKLRGAPGLPTWMQSQFNVDKIEDGKITNANAVSPFGITSLNLTDANQMAERRFKYMFNDLPKTRQTKQVVNLIGVKGDSFSNLDFVNYDPVIDNEISIWRDGRLAPVFGGGTSGTSALGSTAGNNGTQAASNVSGQEKKLQENAANGNKRKDAEFVKWERLNNIANEYMKLPRDSDWSNEFNTYKTTYKVTDEEIAEIKRTRVEEKSLDSTVYTGDGSVSVTIYQRKRLGNPQAPPDPTPPAPPAGPATVGSQGGFTAAPSQIGPTEIQLAGGLPLPKEKLFSKNRYIRFGKAIQILNANSELKSFKVAGKNINVIIDIKNQPIGAFKGIYSTKPESLLIPGELPDFSRFFMEQNITEIIETAQLVPNAIGPNGEISFAQSTALNGSGFKEEPYKWGLLENLYVNFDLFKREIEKPNRTLRETLESILNEMSLAVNSFWNFQVVEKKSVEKKGGDSTVYTVVDENWVGKQVSQPAQFVHSGEQSRFIQADLTIDIPGAMTNKIVAQRLDLATNPDQKKVALGGVFSQYTDKFLQSYTPVGGTTKTNTTKKSENEPEELPEKIGDDKRTDLAKKLDALDTRVLTDEQKKAKEDIKAREIANNKAEKDLDTKKAEIEALIKRQNGYKAAKEGVVDDSFFFVENSDPEKAAYYQTKIDELQKQIDTEKKNLDGATATVAKVKESLQEEAKKFEEGAAQQAASNVSNNLDKIDIVPNPEVNTMTQDDLNKFINDINVFKSKFKVYCCKDAKFLNVLKENNLPVSVGKSSTGSLSQPLPIKYSFTILGRSGIRRGDTFTVLGIPKKYRDHGFFQVTQIEHTLQDMKWTTKVQGEFRQIQ